MRKWLYPILFLLLLCLSGVFAGCAPPQATISLINQGQAAIAGARADVAAQHGEIVRFLAAQDGALDVAFDADVKLIAAGAIKDKAGNAVPLSADWVISARKGYSAAKSIVSAEIRSAEIAQSIRQDNLAAGVDALDLAKKLIIMQMNLSENMKGWLMSLESKVIKPIPASTPATTPITGGIKSVLE